MLFRNRKWVAVLSFLDNEGVGDDGSEAPAGDGGSGGGAANPDTTSQPSGQGDAGGQPTGGTGGGAPKPFLVVNDRTKFNSEADAIRSYNEAGRRIAELSPWQQRLSQSGVKSVDEAAALIKEALDRRAAEAAARGDNDPLKGLNEDQRKAHEWLREAAGRTGIVTKKDLDAALKEIRESITSLGSTVKPLSEAQETAAIEDGQSTLRSLLKEQKYPVSDQFTEMAETLCRAYIEADEERLQKFFSGGSGRKAVIAEALNAAVKPGYDTLLATQIAQNGNRGSVKATTVNRTPVSQPAPRSKNAPPVPPRTAPNKKTEREEDQDNEQKAWEVFQNKLQEMGGQ